MTYLPRDTQIALEQLRRGEWPASTFDVGPPSIDLGVHDSRVDRGFELLRADRWTSQFADRQLDRLRSDRHAAPILIHAIDADLALPLLASWFEARRAIVLWLAQRLRQWTRAAVTLVLPNDLPRQTRKELKSERDIEWIDPKYPSGHWRLLPHVIGMGRSRAIVLDVIAATDLAHTISSGGLPEDRPVAIASEDHGVAFRIARRGAPISELARLDAQEDWIVGPRWRRRIANRDFQIADAELSYHRVRRVPELQSPCIRCGWCEYICPTRCDPVALMNALQTGNERHVTRAGIDSCIDCGLCTNVCPSNLPLNQFIEQLRLQRNAPASQARRTTEAT